MKLSMILLVSLFIVSSCASETTNQTSTTNSLVKATSDLRNALSNTGLMPSYVVLHRQWQSSPGGESEWNFKYAVENEQIISCEGHLLRNGYGGLENDKTFCTSEELQKSDSQFNVKKTVSEITYQIQSSNLDNTKQTIIQDRICFSNITDAGTSLVCFDDNNSLVNYAHALTAGGIYITYWNIEGYAFNQEILSLLGLPKEYYPNLA